MTTLKRLGTGGPLARGAGGALCNDPGCCCFTPHSDDCLTCMTGTTPEQLKIVIPGGGLAGTYIVTNVGVVGATPHCYYVLTGLTLCAVPAGSSGASCWFIGLPSTTPEIRIGVGNIVAGHGATFQLFGLSAPYDCSRTRTIPLAFANGCGVGSPDAILSAV